MSQTTTALFYSTDLRLINSNILTECLTASGSQACLGCMRAPSKLSTWETFQAGIEVDEQWEMINGPMSFAQAAGAVKEECRLVVDVGSPPMARSIHREVLIHIPETVRGRHCPHNMGVSVGWHDIFDQVESENGHFYARASFSVRFWSEHIPSELKEYRSQFFGLSQVQDTKRELERILGRLDSCMLIYV
jgi:hypothetical protein